MVLSMISNVARAMRVCIPKEPIKSTVQKLQSIIPELSELPVACQTDDTDT